MKIYTRTGDDGETGLLGGVRVSKSHLVVEFNGTLDETNSWLGLVRSKKMPDEIETLLKQVQNDLFDLGSRAAACLTKSDRAAKFSKSRVADLEVAIDQLDGALPSLEAFILPSGCVAGCQLHLARSVCRRAERQLVALIESGVGNLTTELVYLNRLADLLFVMARSLNLRAGSPETKWSVTR